jgi:hypothetical protein
MFILSTYSMKKTNIFGLIIKSSCLINSQLLLSIIVDVRKELGLVTAN